MSSNLDGCWPAAARNGDDAMIGYSDLMRCGLVFILSPLLMCAGVRGGSVRFVVLVKSVGILLK